jgi:hypothetical protein
MSPQGYNLYSTEQEKINNNYQRKQKNHNEKKRDHHG